MYLQQIQKLLAYIDRCEVSDVENEGDQHVAMRLDTQLVKGKGPAAIEIRYTDDPSAPAMAMREEDVLKNYPLTYEDLTKALKKRYSDFLTNEKYHCIRRLLESNPKLCMTRQLNPKAAGSSKQRFYNANSFAEFDKHYTKTK